MCYSEEKFVRPYKSTNLANYKAKTKQNLGFCHFSFFWSDSSFLVSCTFIQATLTQNSGFDQIGKQEILLQQRLSRTGFASVAESGFGMWGVEEDLALEEEEEDLALEKEEEEDLARLQWFVFGSGPLEKPVPIQRRYWSRHICQKNWHVKLQPLTAM